MASNIQRMTVDPIASSDETQSRLSRWLDGFLPADHGDADARRRGRVTIRAIVAILFIAPLLVGVHLFTGRPDNAAVVAGVGLMGVLSLYVLKYSQPLASHWILFCTHGLTLFAAFGAGGVRAPMMVWGTLTPPVAVMLLSKRAAWGWWLIWSLEVLGLGLAENMGWVPALLLPRTDALYSVNALIASTFVITLFSLSYERQKDRMLLEEARARRAAERHNASRDRFIANISHELRSPLSGILGMTHLLERTGLTAQQTEFAALLDESSNTLLAIVDDLLDFSRVEAGHFQLVKKRFEIVPLLEKTIDLLALSAQTKGLSLLFTYDELPSATFGDPTRIRQLVTNIVGNAIKFTDQGGVQVHLKGEVENGECAFSLFVEDTGPGIPSDFIDQVFLPFTQADSSSSRKQSGAGLGLAIAREICDQMNGVLEFTSSSKGTRFLVQFTLPIEDASKSSWKHDLQGERVIVDVKAASLRDWLNRLLEREGLLPVETGDPDALAVIRLHEESTTSETASTHMLCYVNLKTPICADNDVTTLFLPIKLRPLLASLMRLQALRRGDSHNPLFRQPSALWAGSKEKRVLVVEDGAVNQRLATLLVEQCGYFAEVACHGREALQMIENKPDAFDAILMDCQMPEMDGYEATRELRRRGFGAPIIALTAHAGTDERKRCLDAGMNDFIEKPVDPILLERKLNAWLNDDDKDSTKRSRSPSP